jgi:hypothetical protein
MINIGLKLIIILKVEAVKVKEVNQDRRVLKIRQQACKLNTLLLI